MEEPVVLENTLEPYMENINLIPDISDYEEVHIIGCGSALYAGMIGKTLLEENTNLRVVCEVASEYRYRKVLYDRRVLVIVISQSGETADTIAALRKAKKAGVHTLGIVNVEGSTIARESDKVIFIKAVLFKKVLWINPKNFLPIYDFINYFLLFFTGSSQVYSCCFNAFVSHQVCK